MQSFTATDTSDIHRVVSLLGKYVNRTSLHNIVEEFKKPTATKYHNDEPPFPEEPRRKPTAKPPCVDVLTCICGAEGDAAHTFKLQLCIALTKAIAAIESGVAGIIP